MWLLVWAALLWTIDSATQGLGSWLDERLAWATRAALLAALWIGSGVGMLARDRAGWGRGRSHAALLKTHWTPPLAAVALAMVVLRLCGMHEHLRIALALGAGYAAGFDATIGALPLLDGRGYRFLRSMPPDETDHLRRRAGDGDVADLVDRDPL